IRELVECAGESSAESIDTLARRWWRRHPNDPRLRFGLALVAESIDSLRHLLDLAGQPARRSADDRVQHPGSSIHVCHRDPSARMPTRLAFVYPGLGCYFEGMGRGLSVLWPEILRTQDAQNQFLRDQFEPAVWWNGDLRQTVDDLQVPIRGQVSI